MLSLQPRTTSGTDLGQVHPSRRSMVRFGSLSGIDHNLPTEREPKNETPKASGDSLHRTVDPISSGRFPRLGREQCDNRGTQGLDYSAFEDVMFSTLGGESSPSLPRSWAPLQGSPSEGAVTPRTAEEVSLSDKFDLVCKFEDVLFAVKRANSLRQALYCLPRGEYNDSLDRKMRQRIVSHKRQASQLLEEYGETPTFRTLVARSPEVDTYVRACGPFGPPRSPRRPGRGDQGNKRGGVKRSKSDNLLWKNFKITQEVRKLMRGLTVASPQSAAKQVNIKAEPED